MSSESFEAKWIILTPDGVPAWWGDNDTPELWDSEKEAALSLAEDFKDTIEQQIKAVKDGHRDYNDIDLECDEHVEAVELYPDGVINGENGIVFDPKEPGKYGR